MRSLLASGAAALGAVVLVLTAPLSAQAATLDVVGNDVSWPQCVNDTSTQGDLPDGAVFGIVGVNDGLANTSNPCFKTEFEWAQSLSGATNQPKAQFYVNTANPGKQGAWWPKSNDTLDQGTVTYNPYGTCKGKPDAACSYVYGWQMASKDLRDRGLPSGSQVWLDVETGNTWSRNTTANRADLEAMATVFKDLGSGSAGIYSTSYQFNKIAGSVTSGPLAGLSSWLAGAKSQDDAKGRCLDRKNYPALTAAGTVTLVQFPKGGFDANLSCVD